jgi:phage shock protein E
VKTTIRAGDPRPHDRWHNPPAGGKVRTLFALERPMRYVLILAALLGLAAACAGADAAPDAASTPEGQTSDAPGSSGTDGPKLLAADDAVDLLAQRDDLVVVDVRTPEEFAEGHLDGAELIDIQAADFGDRIGELDPEVTYVVYCRTGNRSAHAVRAMADIGIGNLYDAGGFAELAAAGAPVAGR